MLYSVDSDLNVDMRASGMAGVARQHERLAGNDLVPDRDSEMRAMAVDPSDTVGVYDRQAGTAHVDAHALVAAAVARPVGNTVHGAGVNRVDRCADRNAEVPGRVVVVWPLECVWVGVNE